MKLVNRLKGFEAFPRRYGFLPYVFLVYLMLPIIYISYAPLYQKISGFALLIIFILSYRQLYFLPPQGKAFSIWLGAEMAVILLLVFIINPNCLFMGFYPANFIGYFTEKKKFRSWLLCLFLVLCLPLIYFEISIHPSGLLYFFPFIVVMLISPFGIRSMNTRMELERKLDKANEQIKELVKREERVRIARDLHDTLGHTLSLITLKSQLVSKLTSADPERAQLEAREIEKTSRAALKQVRELVSDMKAVTVTEELSQLQQIFEAADILYEIKGHFDLNSIPLLYQNMISMCLREAATNIVKHSFARHCTVEMNQKTDLIRIIVRDDGAGFGSKGIDGNGLRGMEERLALIEGDLRCYNNAGAVVEMNIPIIQKAKKEDAAG